MDTSGCVQEVVRRRQMFQVQRACGSALIQSGEKHESQAERAPLRRRASYFGNVIQNMTNCKYFSPLTNPTAAGTRCSPRGKFSPSPPFASDSATASDLLLMSAPPLPQPPPPVIAEEGGQSLWRILASFVSRRDIGGRNSDKQRHSSYTYLPPRHSPANHPETKRNSTVALDADNETTSSPAD